MAMILYEDSSGKALQLEYHSPIRKGSTLYGWGMLLYGTGAV
jgi:hypothetical protein